MRSVGTVALFGLVSLLPVAMLTLTAFVRISVVLVLVRQALGSMQVPGNQALSALALLLTILVMAPVGQRVYSRAMLPLWEHRVGPEVAWRESSEPIKAFMIDQICRTGHQNYLWSLYSHSGEASSRPAPTTCEEFPLQVIAPAFLISELTTALYLGFALFLPFLVVDLVVSAVLSAMGLFLMPPTLVALPIKLALFVLADGWMLVADMLLRSFGSGAAT
jgi:flagellar biosynthetic protein FliP